MKGKERPERRGNRPGAGETKSAVRGGAGAGKRGRRVRARHGDSGSRPSGMGRGALLTRARGRRGRRPGWPGRPGAGAPQTRGSMRPRKWRARGTAEEASTGYSEARDPLTRKSSGPGGGPGLATAGAGTQASAALGGRAARQGGRRRGTSEGGVLRSAEGRVGETSHYLVWQPIQCVSY